MWRNYLKTGIRALWRTRTHSLINILGLSLGIACCVLIALFVRDEWTYDHFHRNASRIYRVWAREDWGENQQFFGTETPFPMGPALKENFQEVEAQVRINKIFTQVKVGDNAYNEPLTIAGEDLFDVFDFELVAGDHKALHAQRSVVITSVLAWKYFGSDNPIGQNLSIQLGETFEDFVVAAVAARVPSNSSIRFNLLISDLNYPKLYPHQTLTSAWFKTRCT
jgi:putative ABC transport system permease protein